MRRFVCVSKEAISLAVGITLATQACDRSTDEVSPGFQDAATGAVSDALGDVPSADSSASNKIPARLVLVTTHYGFFQPGFGIDFTPPAPAGDEAWERRLDDDTAQWRPILAPLRVLREHVTVVAGLSQLAALDANSWQPFVDQHHRTSLTGRPITPQTTSIGNPGWRLRSGPWIDWAVAEHNKPAAGLPIAITPYLDYASVDSAACPGCVGEPEALHGALFQGAEAATPACAARELAAAPPRFVEETLGVWFERMIPVVADAFRCDRTRVFALHRRSPQPEELGALPGRNFEQDFVDQAQAPEVAPVLTRYGQLYAEKIAALAEALRAVPMGDGTLLDYTIIMWVPGVASMPHRFAPWNMVLVGGRKLGLRTGRYLRVAQDRRVKEFGTYAGAPIVPMGGPNNWALTSIARIFGQDLAGFGAEEITLIDGQTVRLSGALPGLFP